MKRGRASGLAKVAALAAVPLAIVRDKAGNERGICMLRNGRRTDEWACFRAHAGQKK